ncbi:hypothetical protein ACHAXN_003593, partial [Cyclotella atomus]
MRRKNIPPPPPRPLSKRLYDLDTRNNDRPPPRSKHATADDESEISDNDSILAMAKRLDAASVISDPSFIEGAQPHTFGLDPDGFGESGSTLGQGHPAESYRNNPYDQQRDLDSIASNDHSEEQHSVYTDDDGSRSEYTEESMERNPYRGVPGVPRVGHHDDMYHEPYRHDEMYDSRADYGHDYRFQGGRPNPRIYENRPPMRGRSQSPKNAMNRRDSRSQSPNMNRGNSRSQSPSARNIKGRGSQYYANNNPPKRYSNTNDMVDDILSERNSAHHDTKRKLKLVAIPIIVLVVVSAVLGIVFATRGDDDRKNTSENNEELIQISLPTPSPTFMGEYNCPDGFLGPVPTKGCLGYAQCDGMGGIEGEVLNCPSKTLYDVSLNTCSWEESVDCSTKVELGESGDSSESLATVAVSPTTKPVTVAATGAAVIGGNKVGPTDTFNHKLSFQGVLSLGDVATFEQNMENYINIFFSSSRGDVLGEDMGTLAANDPILNSITNAKVDLTIKKFEWSGVTRLRYLEENVELIMIYDQNTEYVTSDSSIKVGTVVRYPYEEQYEPFLIEYLKSTDDVFESLSSVSFLEPGQSSSGSQPSSGTSAPAASPSISPSVTKQSETAAPSIAVRTPAPSIETVTTAAPFTDKTTSPPSISAFLTFTEYATVKGLMWIDTNGNGLYETNEPPAVGTFVNLKQCDDKWVQTQQSNANGQYQFIG